MANTKSAQKAVRKIERRTAVNKMRRSQMRTYVRKVEAALDAKDAAGAIAQGLELEPRSAMGHYYLALADDKLGLKAEAKAEYMHAAALDAKLRPVAEEALARLAAPRPKDSESTPLWFWAFAGATALATFICVRRFARRAFAEA